MPTTRDVEVLPSGRLKYRGETFSGYNEPKRTPGKPKKSAVLAKKGNEVKIVRFGDPNMRIRKDNDDARKSYLARSSGIKGANDKFSANYWSRKAWKK